MDLNSIISQKCYINPNGIAFDFTSQSTVTFVLFMGLDNGEKSLKTILYFWKKYIESKLNLKYKSGINVVIISDRRDIKGYLGNYLGIEGLCSNIWELSRLLLDLIYIKNNTKRTVVFGDCGGSAPAILSSTLVPYHSISLTNPYFTVIDPSFEFTTSQYSLWYAKETCKIIHASCQDYENFYDTLTYFDKYTQNTNNMLNLHWSTNVQGTDLMFRHQANLLPQRHNIKITDHIIPDDVDGHKLVSHLLKTYKLQKLILDEIKIQFSNIETL